MPNMFNLFSKKEAPAPSRPKVSLTLHNTFNNSDEEFSVPDSREVKMYNCGPTVYGPAHIGNLRSYIFADTLRRTLEYNTYKVKQVINITDVGHLTSDADSGEDKMSKGLRREGLDLSLENMNTLAEKYTKRFEDDLQKLNIKTEGTEFPRASKYIHAQVAMIKTLEEKGYTYSTSDGVYFDTSRFPAYGKLGNIDIEKLKEGARVDTNGEKRNPVDFALWKFDSQLGFDSPWGLGFPGWHIECSAMARAVLGEKIDIHTGGIDHIPVHHNNEIAQSEAATGKKPFARFWLHNAFITIDDEKISKSLGNDVFLDSLDEKKLHPLSLRYLYLGARYSSPINFSWKSLEGAQQALLRLYSIFNGLEKSNDAEVNKEYQKQFHKKINENLDTAGALAVVWELVKDTSLSPASIRATLINFDSVLGLNLGNGDKELGELLQSSFGSAIKEQDIPKEVQEILTEREEARKAKDFKKADDLRDKLSTMGYEIEDSPDGVKVVRR